MPDEPTEGIPDDRRLPQHKLSEEEKQQIREMFLRPDVAGSINVTAEMLGLNYGCVERFAHRDPFLRNLLPERDVSKTVPDEVEIINRPRLPDEPPAVGTTLSKDEFDKYQMLLRQNKPKLVPLL